jgi:putative spermidine/putrescine transport system permease protein
LKRFSPLLKTVVVLTFVAILMPIVVVIGVSFNPTSSFSVNFGGMSLRWYQAFFTGNTFVKALFQVSLPIAFASALCATVIGALAAITIVRFRFAGKELLETAFMLPLFIPSILLGAALYLFFSRFHAGGTYASLIVGHTLLGTPYVIRVVSAGLSGISTTLEEAAMSLGCNRVTAFRKVVLPLLRSSLLSGAIFAFMVSFSDINLALFVSGPNTTTMPLQIFSEIVWQGDPTVAAASTIQIVLVSSLVLLVQKAFRVRLAF